MLSIKQVKIWCKKYGWNYDKIVTVAGFWDLNLKAIFDDSV